MTAKFLGLSSLQKANGRKHDLALIVLAAIALFLMILDCVFLIFGNCDLEIYCLLAGGLHMEILSASFASSKCTKMPSIVTPVLIPKVGMTICDVSQSCPFYGFYDYFFCDI